MGTAEVIIKGLERGDLSWREIIAKRNGEVNE